MNMSFPIPTGLCPSAQGCPVSGATLGNVAQHFSQPQRGCVNRGCADGFNPVGVVFLSDRSPRVARASQPWAERHSPVGADKSRTLAALRDALLPKPLSGALRQPAAAKLVEAKV